MTQRQPAPVRVSCLWGTWRFDGSLGGEAELRDDADNLRAWVYRSSDGSMHWCTWNPAGSDQADGDVDLDEDDPLDLAMRRAEDQLETRGGFA